MIYIKLPESLRKTAPKEKKNVINSDETWAFTEQPRNNVPPTENDGVTAHDLFNLFTANIIQDKTVFTR